MGHGRKDGWPVHLACCLKTEETGLHYCAGHMETMFNEPNTTPKELARSLRRHT